MNMDFIVQQLIQSLHQSPGKISTLVFLCHRWRARIFTVNTIDQPAHGSFFFKATTDGCASRPMAE
jgi:hypothetical protein